MSTIADLVARLGNEVIVLGPAQPEQKSAATIAAIDSALADPEQPEYVPPSSFTKWVIPVVYLLEEGAWSEPSNFRFNVSDYALPTENVLVKDRVRNPIDKTWKAVGYLEAQKAAVDGPWDHYVEDPAGPKRPDLGFFFIFGYKETAGITTETRYLVTEDSEGNPIHRTMA